MKIVEANGASIPAIGLGTWDLRGDTCRSIVEKAIGEGYRHLDTAIMYENEAEVGEGIAASGIDRNELFITTKVWPDNVADGPFQNAVQASLDRLGVNRVNLLLIHWPPHNGDINRWAALLDEAVEKGWTHHIGVSNFTVDMLDGMNAALSYPLVCNQVENHPFLDQSNIRTACAKHGMAIVGYCPLFRGGNLFEHDAVKSAAATHGKTEAQIVLRWHVQHDGAIAIPKTATPTRLSENKDVFDFELTEQEMAAISALGTRQERLCDFEFSPQWDAA